MCASLSGGKEERYGSVRNNLEVLVGSILACSRSHGKSKAVHLSSRKMPLLYVI